MKRYLYEPILKDLPKKVVLVTGPRQCGKTTLAKQLSEDWDYFYYDFAEDRLALSEMSWNRKKELIIFDELHKSD
ncbi:MAG: AAA family ATPase [Chlamydiia bacterium]|nr:AAA family ATPase [Chlamydiia bacterium]